jgi:hypothetical protein
LYKPVLFSAVGATLSCLSSGPWIALAALLGINYLYSRTYLIKPGVYIVLLFAILIEIASNRHFYHLIDYLALDKTTAWYRTRLIEVAFSNVNEWWIAGVGSSWPNHWANSIDGRGFLDVVNNYLIIALYGGLPALIMYISAHVVAIKRAVLTFRSSRDIPHRQLIFGLVATLVALDFASFSVGLFGPALLLGSMILGFINSVSTTWNPNAEPAGVI